MAILLLDSSDNFSALRNIINQSSLNVGDLTVLTTPDTSSLVAAINNIDSDLTATAGGVQVYDKSDTLLNP
jgi:hypothetical protein